MVRLLRTPGLQRLVGRSTALLTFTGRNSGATFTTPISYVRRGPDVILSADRSRQWWRNLGTHPHVMLRLAGTEYSGTATILEEEAALAALTNYFAALPTAARAARVGRESDGRIRREDVARRLDTTVVVAVSLTG